MKFNEEQEITILQNLIHEGNYQKAVELGSYLLNYFPQNKTIVKLLEKAEKYYKQEQTDTINEALNELEPLWKQGAYKELQSHYQKLYILFPDHLGLQKKMLALQEKLYQLEEEEYCVYLKKGIVKLNSLVKEARYKEAIQAATELLHVDEHNIEAHRLLEKAKIGFVDQKLPQRQIFLEQGDFENLLRFYKQLQKIAPEHKQLNILLENAQKEIQKKENTIKQERREILLRIAQKSLENKEFSRGYEACNQMLAIDPYNEEAKKLLHEIASKERKINQNQLFQEMFSEKENKGNQEQK